MVIQIRRNRIDEYAGVMSLGVENDTVLDKFCALMLAVSPILQHYRGLFQNAGFTVLLLAVPIIMLRMLLKRAVSNSGMAALLPFILFEIYTVLDYSFSASRLMLVLFILFFSIATANGYINTAYFLKYATDIVSVASGLLIVQYISFYVFHKKINLRPLSLLVSQNTIWVRNSLATFSERKLYRPAAFFLEPSHFYLYSFPVLCVLLLSPNITAYRKKMALWVTMGMLLTTSGFGIFASLGVWGVYLWLYAGTEKRRRIISRFMPRRTFILIVLFVVLTLVAYLFVPVFTRSVNRVFFPTEGSSAIDGRVRLARRFVLKISDRAVWFGQTGVVGDLDFNLAGFFSTYIRFGVIGLVLSYWFYGQGLWKLKGSYFWMTFLILATSFFSAHTHGTFYMLYYIVYLMNGYFMRSRTKPARI